VKNQVNFTKGQFLGSHPLMTHCVA